MDRSCRTFGWPAHSPYLNSLDFYLWRHLKAIVYSYLVDSIEIYFVNVYKKAANKSDEYPIFFKMYDNLHDDDRMFAFRPKIVILSTYKEYNKQFHIIRIQI